MRGEFRTALALAVRHHPLCAWFNADRFGPFCSGCAVFWPAFFLASIVAVPAALGRAWPLLLASAVLGLPQLLTLKWRFGRLLRATIKVLGGVSVGGALPAILFLPLPWIARLSVLALMAAAFTTLMALRARSILRTCDACPWRRDWANCPGFRVPQPRPSSR